MATPRKNSNKAGAANRRKRTTADGLHVSWGTGIDAPSDVVVIAEARFAGRMVRATDTLVFEIAIADASVTPKDQAWVRMTILT